MKTVDLRKKAESGDVVAQTVLGTCYLDGADVEVDYKQAFRFLSAAADKGAARAMTNLARMYAEGRGIAKIRQLRSDSMKPRLKRGNSSPRLHSDASFRAG